MPFTGTIQSWQDDRGFGFIQPTQGGQAVFVHIKSFTSRGGSRPQVGQRVTFEVELNAQSKKRAKNVAVVRAATASAVPRQRQRQRRAADSPAQWGTASLFALPAFLLVYVAVAIIWRVPGWVAALYAGASVVCALVYAIDKSAAVAGGWRVSESTLHTLSLVGGWAGGRAHWLHSRYCATSRTRQRFVRRFGGLWWSTWQRLSPSIRLWLRAGGFDSRCSGGGCAKNNS